MNHPYVITIGRELGAGGKAIAEIMAASLAIPVYDRRLILMAARQSGLDPSVFKKADEVPNRGLMSHIIRSLSSPFASFSSLYSNSMSQESLFKVQADIIRDKAAAESCIIVGRCSDYILRHHPRHVSIFVRADRADRVQRIACSRGITPAEAASLIDRADAVRSRYHDFYSETNWGDSRAYDLCVNSSLLGIEGTARLLLSFVREKLELPSRFSFNG